MDRRTFCKQGIVGLAALVLGCAETPRRTVPIASPESAEEAVTLAMQSLRQQNYADAVTTLETYHNPSCNITVDYLLALTLVAKAGTFNPIDPDCWKNYNRAGDLLSEVVNRFLQNSYCLDTLQEEVPPELFALPDYRKGKKQLASFGAIFPRLYGLLGFMSLVERRYDPACKYFAAARDKISDNDKHQIKKFHDNIRMCGQRAFNKYNEWLLHDTDSNTLEQLRLDMKGLMAVTNVLIPDEELDDSAYTQPYSDATLNIIEPQK